MQQVEVRRSQSSAAAAVQDPLTPAHGGGVAAAGHGAEGCAGGDKAVSLQDEIKRQVVPRDASQDMQDMRLDMALKHGV